MKAVTNIFKSIFNFLDRFIILPITRFIYKVTKRLSIPNKKFETWLSKQSTLLFLSLFMAILVYIVVDQKIISFSSQNAEVFKDQSINVIYDEELYVVEGLPDKVDVTLIGSKPDLYIAKQSANNGVTVDLTGLKPGTHKVNIEYDQGNSKIEYNVNPSVATVIIYEKVSDTRPLTYDIVNDNKLNSTLIVNGVKLSTEQVTIRGPEYKINQVATVKALIDINNITNKQSGTQELKDVVLKAYDGDGNIVDVEIIPSTQSDTDNPLKVTAQVELSSPSKTVPLNFVPKGKFVTGKAIAGYKFSENEVTIYGDSEILSKINSLDVEVDVSKLTNNTSFRAEITKPTGVKSISTSYITVSVTMTDASSEPVRFKIPLTGINVKEGFGVNPIDDNNGLITVEVQGASSVLSTIDESDIKVYVDLSDVDKEGTYTRKIIVKGNNPLVTYEALRTEATVTITKK